VAAQDAARPAACDVLSCRHLARMRWGLGSGAVLRPVGAVTPTVAVSSVRAVRRSAATVFGAGVVGCAGASAVRRLHRCTALICASRGARGVVRVVGSSAVRGCHLRVHVRVATSGSGLLRGLGSAVLPRLAMTVRSEAGDLGTLVNPGGVGGCRQLRHVCTLAVLAVLGAGARVGGVLCRRSTLVCVSGGVLVCSGHAYFGLSRPLVRGVLRCAGQPGCGGRDAAGHQDAGSHDGGDGLDRCEVAKRVKHSHSPRRLANMAAHYRVRPSKALHRGVTGLVAHLRQSACPSHVVGF